MKLNKINDFIVNKVHVPPLPSIENIAGGNLFGQLYVNAFLIASKNSGKTTVLSSIILKSINKKTNVIFFVSTASKDSTYQYIFDKLDKRNVNYTVYNEIEQDGTNIIDTLIDGLLITDPIVIRKKDKKLEEPPPIHNLFEKQKDKVERQSKKLAPKYIIVIDDMSNSTRDPCIARLLKIHRHLKASVFISSQNLNDITPPAFRQLDYALIFRGLSSNIPKLEQIYTNLDLPIDFNNFLEIYRDATEHPYNFLWCSKSGKFRKNFNMEYEL